jgi:ribonuclease P protein component
MPFDKHSRLRTRADFDVVFTEGRKVVNRELVARIRPIEAGRPSRLGLSVSRKVGNAPRRNRVKRCLRAAFRELRPTLSGPIDLVLIARPQQAPDNFEAARRSLRDVFRRHERGGRPA